MGATAQIFADGRARCAHVSALIPARTWSMTCDLLGPRKTPGWRTRPPDEWLPIRRVVLRTLPESKTSADTDTCSYQVFGLTDSPMRSLLHDDIKHPISLRRKLRCGMYSAYLLVCCPDAREEKKMFDHLGHRTQIQSLSSSCIDVSGRISNLSRDQSTQMRYQTCRPFLRLT